jgi:hypothetical protein
MFSQHRVFLFSLSFLICGFYLYAVLYVPQWYVLATYEDLYGEWVQTFSFLATSIFSFLIIFNTKQKTAYRAFFTLLGIAALYVFLEEISWGQRLIGFGTPEFFEKHNYQDEVNFHNLLTGPVDVWTKTFLEYFISCGLICYGLNSYDKCMTSGRS